MQRFLVLLSFVCSPLFAKDPYPVNPTIDVQHYVFKLSLPDSGEQIEAEATLLILLKKDVEGFELDLVGKQGEPGMQISSLAMDGKTVPFQHTENRIKIGSGGKAGTTLQVRISYGGVAADGLIIGTNLYGDRTFFGDNWPDRARHWLPTVDHPSDKATCEFIVEAPVYYQVIANGSLKEETMLTDTRKLTHWVEQKPIATKVMVMGAARFAVEHVGLVGGVPVQSWVYPQNREAGFYDYAPAKEILETLVSVLGPYPYEKLANVQSKTRYGGMENAGNIFYFEKSVTGQRTIEGLIAHEIAHQWFGNSASEKDWHHVWLSEGFATYFTQVYREKKYGTDSLRAGMTGMKPAIFEYYQKNPKSTIVDTTILELKKLLSTNTYQKASWVLHMLRKEVGDQAFFDGVRKYCQTYEHSNALTADFRAIMEEVSGKQLDSFFQQWLYQPLYPEISVSWKYDSKRKKLVLTAETKASGSYTLLPLEIGIIDDNGAMENMTLEIKGKLTTAEWDMPKAPADLIADPEVWLLGNISVKRK